MDTVYTRLEYLFGNNDVNKLKNATVCVVGLGGVGGMAVEVLARSGVGTIIINDFDTINITNVNRQVIANQESIGKLKVSAFKEFIYNINPDINVITISSKFDSNCILFRYKIDYLIDAIDDVNNKYLLIKECLNRKITFISSMGTAKKVEPSKLEVIDISKTEYDPIAKLIRGKLRKDSIEEKFMVVSSKEEPKDIKLLGSYMPVTGYAGMLCADYIIKKILETK